MATAVSGENPEPMFPFRWLSRCINEHRFIEVIIVLTNFENCQRTIDKKCIQYIDVPLIQGSRLMRNLMWGNKAKVTEWPFPLVGPFFRLWTTARDQTGGV
jgi:hypothetical protein